ncbi:MAG: methylmalonyl Co-A mutase-associated GTPase MeaB [Anaerolineae bacterium]|nr:methylmalonyl Co-A mutase-associated GTPase MeaB [Anaerolineae bacterium]
MDKLVAEVLAGNRRALARLLTQVENERPEVLPRLTALFPHTGRAHIIGITGAPGTGKSSLVNALAKRLRAQQQTVAIIAVDPTSPFSGGAILGDRIRMVELAGDAGVFIRSMATRGSLGGLARATRDMVRVLDAAGFDVVLVETVGAGQNEVDIARTAQTTLVVEAPGLGDEVQAIKAGILEIADILVVNKADRPGALQTVRSLKMMVETGHPAARERFAAHHGRLLPVPALPAGDEVSLWQPPVLQTVATENTGLDDLLAAIAQHRQFWHSGSRVTQLQERYIEIELYERLQQALMQRFVQALPPELVSATLQQIRARRLDPQSAIEQLLNQVETHGYPSSR